LVEKFTIQKCYSTAVRQLREYSPGEACDIVVNQPYMINEIKFNANLNKRFADALVLSGNPMNLIEPFTIDYEYNQRHFATYLVNCSSINCQNRDLTKLSALVNVPKSPMRIITSSETPTFPR
jgi:hypothetical protein